MSGMPGKFLLSALLALGLAACSPPTHSVHTLDEKAQLAIANAPDKAEILVDGTPAGLARTYDGESNTLALTGGTHRIEIRLGGQALYSQPVFFGEGTTKTITLP